MALDCAKARKPPSFHLSNLRAFFDPKGETKTMGLLSKKTWLVQPILMVDHHPPSGVIIPFLDKPIKAILFFCQILVKSDKPGGLCSQAEPDAGGA